MNITFGPFLNKVRRSGESGQTVRGVIVDLYSSTFDVPGAGDAIYSAVTDTSGKAVIEVDNLVSFRNYTMRATYPVGEYDPTRLDYQHVVYNNSPVGDSTSQVEKKGVCIKFHPHATPEQKKYILSHGTDRNHLSQIDTHIIQVPNADLFAEIINRRDEVEFAELDNIREPEITEPNDPYWTNWHWQLRHMNCQYAWDISKGDGVTIAILDSGIFASHEDLAAKIVSGWNIYNNNSDTNDYTGHGTICAGIAGAVTDNGKGVSSVGWNCMLMPVRIASEVGSTVDSRIAAGIIYAADHGARVASISFQGSNSSVIDTAAQYMMERGGVVVVAAGNGGYNDPSPDDPYVITVGWIDPDDTLNTNSNRGANVDVVAPGTGFTTIKSGGYNSLAGTSISVPYVAGVAALTISSNPSLTGQQVYDIIINSAADLGDPGRDDFFGYGKVDAYAAVLLASSGSVDITDTTNPVCSMSTPTANATVSGTVSVNISATDNVAVTSTKIYVDSVVVSTASASSNSYSWNTLNYVNGTHALSGVASDANGNTHKVGRFVTVYNPTVIGDTTAPTCSITSPINGSKVADGNITISTTSSDDTAVVKIDLYVDGKLKTSDTIAPFSFSLNTKSWKKNVNHTMYLKAYDAAGNVGLSSTITVSK